MMKSIYVLSGLGADERVFQKLDFSGFDVTYIQWITPYANERIENYAQRLTSQIKTHKPILIGLSFGGMMATEVAKLIEVEQTILISSAKNRLEIPFYFRLVGTLKLHRLIPIQVFKSHNIFTNWLFGINRQEEEELLKRIILDTDKTFLAWAIDKIVTWKRVEVHANLKHIHGTADKILPFCFVKSDVVVKNGGHLMTLNKAEEVTKAIRFLIK